MLKNLMVKKHKIFIINERRSIMSSNPQSGSFDTGPRIFAEVAQRIVSGGTNMVTSVQSPTGSGKSTKMPIDMAMRFEVGSNNLILVLMPIVAAATGAAAQVSSQGISAVAWTGQFDKPNVNAGVQIVFMTYGCFNRLALQTKGEIFPGRQLHIIADEIHVSSDEVSFALKALAVIQKNRMVYPTILSITVMSATLDRDAIAAMFDGEVEFQDVEYMKPFPHGPLKVVEMSTGSSSKFLEFAVEQVVIQLRELSDSGSLQGDQKILVIAPGVNTATAIMDGCKHLSKFVFWNRFPHKTPPILAPGQILIILWSSEGVSTGVTITDMCFLIIIGMCKNMSSTDNPLITQMGVRPMTKAEITQSLGRANRIEPTPVLLIIWEHPRIPKQEHSPSADLSQFHNDLIEATLEPSSGKDNNFFLRGYGFSYKNCMKILSSFVPPEIFLKLSKLKTVSADDKRKLVLLMELLLRFFGKSTSIIGQIIHVEMVEVMGRHSRVPLLERDENGLIQFCLDAVIQRNTDGLALPPKFTFAHGGERLFFRQLKSFIYEATAALSVFGHFNRDDIKPFEIPDFFGRNPSLLQIVAFTEPYVRVKNVNSDISQTDSNEPELVPCSKPIICPFGIIFPASVFSILSTGSICVTLPEADPQESDDEELQNSSDDENETIGFGGGAASPNRSGFSRGRGSGGAASPNRSGFSRGRGNSGAASSAPFGFEGRGNSGAASPAPFGFGRGRGSSGAASSAPFGFEGRGSGGASSPAPFGFEGRGGSTAAAPFGFGGGRGDATASAEPKLLPPGQGRGAPPLPRGRGGKF